jgi:hypothetical protein
MAAVRVFLGGEFLWSEAMPALRDIPLEPNLTICSSDVTNNLPGHNSARRDQISV